MKASTYCLVFLISLGFLATDVTKSLAAEIVLPIVRDVEQQPLVAATERLVQALQFAGSPLTKEESAAIDTAIRETEKQKALEGIQQVLDKHVLALVTINPESRVSVAEGPAKKQLVQEGWTTFLIKVNNLAGITPKLKVDSPNVGAVYLRGKSPRQKPLTQDGIALSDKEIQKRFLDLAMLERQPLKPRLSGLELEYRILQIYSRDAGKRETTLKFDVGQGSQDLGFRSELPVLFDIKPAVNLVLHVRDEDGSPTTAAFVVKDQQGHVFPNPARRLAPDFFFHNQIYRADGESVSLPPGEYDVVVTRGPEYLPIRKTITVNATPDTQHQTIRLARWIHPKLRNWYSGDHHVHAAGCSHYDSPTEGVKPSDMLRHIIGEDLNVGCVLSWGPCWYTQKQFFEGQTSSLSKKNNLMRYDVEVSGFPSSHAGHLCLLRLSEDDYPGTKRLEEWPSWTMPILQWGQKQDAVVGYSHSGWGLALPDYAPNGKRLAPIEHRARAKGQLGRAAYKLPDYAMPLFDSIGANEYIVTVAHGACDFISAVDTPAIWELNIWYHTLNCGMRARISGETDFPCIYGDKVGLGRAYVKLDDDEPLNFDSWVKGIKNGRSYCTDGLSHIFDFKVNDVAVGEPGNSGKISQLDLTAPGKVNVQFEVAALLEEKPNEETEQIRQARLDEKPYWHIERCRIGETRKVPVEIIVNGQPVARKDIVADGSTENLSFDIDIPHSSWVAVRILPSVHTNPVFVHVAGKPIRASRRSAQWCQQAVKVCWDSKEGRFREDERKAAEKAYKQAAEIYAKIEKEALAE